MRVLRTSACTLALLLIALSVARAKTNYAYVANYVDNTVSVINTSNNNVVETIAVGTNPSAVAVNQAGTYAYVTNFGSANVSVISTSSNTVVATIPVQSQPSAAVFAPNGKTAYVANQGSNSVSVISTGSKKVTATIPVQALPDGLAILPNGAFLYVANFNSYTVSVISTLTNTVVMTVGVDPQPTSVAISPDGSTAYVTSYANGTVSVIRTADSSVVNTIQVFPLGNSGPFAGAVSPDGRWLYVTGISPVAFVLDTNTQTPAGTIPIGPTQAVSFRQDSAYAYITEPAANSVAVVNTATMAVATTVTVGDNPQGVGVMGTKKVSTVAGGYVGDKGPATNAALGNPGWSARDSAGNLYISDYVNHRIRKMSPGGTITTYVGTGICGYNGENVKSTKAMICQPTAVIVNGYGELIFADDGNSRIRKITAQGVVSTIAGTGAGGYTGDGGPATSAHIGGPVDLAYDSAGNLYFSQLLACVVRKVDSSGVISTVAGTGRCGYNGDGVPATQAQLRGPRGIAFDSSGNMYLSDGNNNRVRKIDSSGTISTFAGTGTAGFSGDGGLATSAEINGPRGLAMNNGVLYIADTLNARYRSVNLSSNIINTYAGSTYGYDGDGQSLLSTEFEVPRSILFDGAGNPIFDDSGQGRVRKATNGVVNTIAGGFVGDGNKATSAAFQTPEALAIDKSGNLYIADFDQNRVRKVSGGLMSTVAGTGISGYSGDGGPATNARLSGPQGVAVDSQGNIFIADTNNNLIRKVNTSGVITTFASNANFGYLLQMATDSSNNVYLADVNACVIWKISSAGTVGIAAGVLNTCGYNGDGIAATTAQLYAPYSVAVLASGDLLIADMGNSRVREVNSSGIITTIAGDGNCNYSGDGGPATAAELCSPNSLAADKSGTIYVADFSYDRIRKISGGIISAFAGYGYGLNYPYYPGFNGDGLWPLYTALDDPIAVAVDSKGAVYELDDSDLRVRQIK